MDNDTNKRIQNLERQMQEFMEWKRNKDVQQISYPLDEVSRTIINRDTNSTVSSFITTPDPTTLTIASGAVTVSQSYHEIDTEGGAATDDLDTINDPASLTDVAILVLRATSSSRTVVLKDGTGNLRLAGDFSLDHNRDTITLIGTGGIWYEVSRSDNDI